MTTRFHIGGDDLKEFPVPPETKADQLNGAHPSAKRGKGRIFWKTQFARERQLVRIGSFGC
jgi:hypothetical protein